MVYSVEAIYEGSLLRPLRPLGLAESQRVQITVSDLPGERSSRDLDVVERARREVAGAGVVPDIAEVRAALALIGGSMAESVIAERGEY